ncbi:MAG: hypothetical protein M3004_00785, partial [Bacteroidota bacterium]|nr:hypothetical protein [Bacteroidota bacterium]
MKKVLLYASSIFILIVILNSCKQHTNFLNTKFSTQITSQKINSPNNLGKKRQIQIANILNQPSKNKGTVFTPKVASENEENEMYDGAAEAQKFEIEKTKDPNLGYVPKERLLSAIEYTSQIKQKDAALRTTALSWAERGPNSDLNGPYGNSRPPGTITSGRMRAIWVDNSDASGNTVWIGGIDGGIWKTTNFNSNPANWAPVSDFFSNLSVSSICQDPTDPNVMYFGTGEKAFNADAVRGGGVWRSTDHGASFTPLNNTTSFYNVSKILCDAAGNVYCATIGSGSGLQRSNDKGSNWTNISITGVSSRYPDFEISSTGRMHVCTGYYNSTGTGLSVYRYTDNPATVTNSTWTAPTNPFPISSYNTELVCNGNILYALVSNSSFIVPTIYKSIDGGDNWAGTGAVLPSTGNGAFSNGQAWYCLAADVDPTDAKTLVIGSLNCYKSVDSGATFSKISDWVGTAVQYVHADQQTIKYLSGNRILVGCDGGIHYSSNGGTNFSDRNTNLRIKQFYSVAIHPTSTNYFLAGAQDNGVHQFNNGGLSNTVEVTGGDGAFVAIDQDQPQYQFGSYVFNQYRRSTDGGASWAGINYSGTSGRFINPWDYDNNNNKLYAAGDAATYLRWENPQTGSTFTSVAAPLLSGIASAVKVSPFTANLLYLGSGSGSLLKVSAANTSSPEFTDIKSSFMPAGYVSCINTGSNDQNLIMCFSNYGVTRVWVSNNGGTSWTGIDGNLPDMPVRWAMFYPGDNAKAIIATETGVWETTNINGTSTVWTANASFPNVRTDMLK